MGGVYIAGPMTGIESFNFPAFFAAEEKLAFSYNPVYNPARHDMDMGGVVWDENTDEYSSHESFNLADALLWDLARVAEVDTVYVLPNWENSKGVAAELALARALGKEIVYEVPRGAEGGKIEGVVNLVNSNLHILGSTVGRMGGDGKSGEVRTTSSTGGEKGMKLARYDLLPPDALRQLAEHYGAGARKYDDNQWRKGYEWSKSYAAMMRHANQFWAGEDFDEETGSNHLAAVAWHAFTLLTYFNDFPEFDDRYKVIS